MKVERQSKTFTPITITIESQVELDALLIGMNHSRNSLRSFVENNGVPSECTLEDLEQAKDDFWDKLSDYQEVQ